VGRDFGMMEVNEEVIPKSLTRRATVTIPELASTNPLPTLGNESFNLVFFLDKSMFC